MNYIVKAVEDLYNNSHSLCRNQGDRGLKFVERVLSYLTPESSSIDDLKMAYNNAIDETRRDGGKIYSWGQMAVVRLVHRFASEC